MNCKASQLSKYYFELRSFSLRFKLLVLFVILQVALLIYFFHHPWEMAFFASSNTTKQNGNFKYFKVDNDEAMVTISCSDNFNRSVGEKYYERYFSSVEYLDQINNVEPGGVWKPSNCSAHEKLVIIVPYRNRSENLQYFLTYMHKFLQHQMLDYRIVVVEQSGKAKFNRGMLMNIGFVETKRLQKVECVIFHDVDLLPENDLNVYRCVNFPKHMSAYTSKLGYRLPYESYFGGVEAFKPHHYKLINGFSNVYFGWGAEDDDLEHRIRYKKLPIHRDSKNIARYKSLNHGPQEINIHGYHGEDLLKKCSERFETDGLNSLDYKRLKITTRPLFTHILVDIDKFYKRVPLQNKKN